MINILELQLGPPSNENSWLRPWVWSLLVHGGLMCFDILTDWNLWVNSLVDFCGLICLAWIDFCEVGVVFVMGWGMLKGILINLGLIFFFFLGDRI